MMTDPIPTTETPISELLKRWPEVIPVFNRHKMACVGCTMSAYETVASAAEIYHLQVDQFLSELVKTISE